MKMQNLAVITAMIFLAGLNVFAQGAAAGAADDREISKQFGALQSKSWEIRRSHASREATEIISTDEKTAKQLKQTRISEFVPPDRRRYIVSVEIDGKVKSFETITIGDQTYSREDEGQWKSSHVDTRSASGVGNSQTKFIEKTTIDGRSVTVFEDKWSTYSDFGNASGVTMYWFTEDGYLLKTVEKRRSEGEKFDRVSTTTFEYDPNIKIETPLVK